MAFLLNAEQPRLSSLTETCQTHSQITHKVQTRVLEKRHRADSRPPAYLGLLKLKSEGGQEQVEGLTNLNFIIILSLCMFGKVA